MPAFPDNKSVYLFMRWFTFMRKRVKWPLVSALKGREGLLGRPGGGGGLLGHRGGLDEAAVEGVLWVVVGYWEQKTNRKAKRSVRGFCTVLLEQQSVLTQSHRGVAESVALSEWKNFLLVLHVSLQRLRHYGFFRANVDILMWLSSVFTLRRLEKNTRSWRDSGSERKKIKPCYVRNSQSKTKIVKLL